MRLSETIIALQDLQRKLRHLHPGEDPIVITTPESHGIRGTVLDATLGMHNPGGKDEGCSGPLVLSVELEVGHYSKEAQFDYLWR